MKRLIFISAILGVTFSCKKLTNVPAPQNQLTTDKVFSDTSSANAALLNCYALFDKTVDPNYNKFLGLYTDELTYSGSTPDLTQFYQGNLSATNGVVSNMWKNLYFAVYSANQVNESLSAKPDSSSKNLVAEAGFLRAYAYYYLVNTFGAVPLVLTTDVNKTATASRADTTTVYNQIIADLKSAQQTLTETYTGPGKVRANKLAATTLLAKAYLCTHDWVNAESQATAVINSGLYTPLASPSGVFIANNNEAILQFYTQNGYISDGPSLIPSSGVPTYQLTNNLLNDFETGDLRRTNWVKTTTVTTSGSSKVYYSPYKYKNRVANAASPEFLMALRAAELYLIRAEARAQQGNISGAVQDINVVRQRANLLPLPATLSQATCFNAISQERRVEFFAEWGSRFIDLRRTGRLNTVMSAYKISWSSKSNYLPIPQSELTYDANLTQNPGY